MSSSSNVDSSSSDSDNPNPIGLVEDYAIRQDWGAERSNEFELWAEIPGQWGGQRLWAVYHDDTCFLQINCYLNLKITSRHSQKAGQLITMMNERVWLGHFEIWSEEQIPVFRIVVPLRNTELREEQLEDIMSSIQEETDRFFPALQWVIWGGKTPEEAIAAAIIDTEGEA
ncbi:MAG: YbjN domain-containing protein [Magnetococcales bacterium]|nr:YbjN domain-containing protein [Magnetococcales bacterium]